MKTDIILSGVGGQGILSIASVIGLAAMSNNLYIKQSEVHGMSQRGGDVESHLRLSDKPVYSDLIPYGMADIIISVEPMEALRHLPWLLQSGWIVTSSCPFENIKDYPPVNEILDEIRKIKNNIIIDAESIAKGLASPRSGNMVVLGAASHFLNMPFESLENAVREFFGKKGETVVDLNIKALRAGRNNF